MCNHNGWRGLPDCPHCQEELSEVKGVTIKQAVLDVLEADLKSIADLHQMNSAWITTLLQVQQIRNQTCMISLLYDIQNQTRGMC